jgi:hypothetical protein
MTLETPFNMIILGMTSCGKTYYLLKMLETEYSNHFDYIFLICPTYEWNDTYQSWKYKDDEKYFPIPCDHYQIEDFIKFIVVNFRGTKLKKTNSLIILDDCAGGQSVKNRTSELVNLGLHARHYGFSTIVITQQLTSISKTYRENVSKLVTFYNSNRNNMNTILDEFLDIEKDEERNIIDILKNNKYARLEILLRHPYKHNIIHPT